VREQNVVTKGDNKTIQFVSLVLEYVTRQL